MVRPVKLNKFDWSDIKYGSPEYHRRWRLANGLHSREYHRKYDSEQYKKHPERERDRRLIYNAKYPNRVKANRKLNYALHKGYLSKLPCSVCSNLQSIAHHDDYSKPLEVIWLCELHHKVRHRAITVVE